MLYRSMNSLVSLTYLLSLPCPNPSRFNKELKKLISQNATLSNYKVLLNVVTHNYPSYYLTRRSTLHKLNSEKITGGDRERADFSENDLLVIKHIVENPEIRITALAKVTKLNIKTVKTIIRNLTKKRIMKDFKYTVNTNNLGINKSIIFLKLHNLSVESEADIIKFMRTTDEIVQVNKTVGDWNMEVHIASPDKAKIRLITRKLREEFKEQIVQFNLIEFLMHYKKEYLPRYLFV